MEIILRHAGRKGEISKRFQVEVSKLNGCDRSQQTDRPLEAVACSSLQNMMGRHRWTLRWRQDMMQRFKSLKEQDAMNGTAIDWNPLLHDALLVKSNGIMLPRRC